MSINSGGGGGGGRGDGALPQAGLLQDGSAALLNAAAAVNRSIDSREGEGFLRCGNLAQGQRLGAGAGLLLSATHRPTRPNRGNTWRSDMFMKIDRKMVRQIINR